MRINCKLVHDKSLLKSLDNTYYVNKNNTITFSDNIYRNYNNTNPLIEYGDNGSIITLVF